MKFTTTFAALLFSASSILSAPVDVVTRDVWVPQILDPTDKTVWHVGNTYPVKWALDNKPTNVTSFIGTVFLSTNGRLNISA